MDIEKLKRKLPSEDHDMTNPNYWEEKGYAIGWNAALDKVKELIKPQSPATAQGVPLSREECTKFVDIKARRSDHDGIVYLTVTGMLPFHEVIKAMGYPLQPASDQRQTVVADGMPERIWTIDNGSASWTDNPQVYHLKHCGGTQYTRSDLCPPADVLQRVADDLGFYSNQDNWELQEPSAPEEGFSGEDVLVDCGEKAKQAIALLQPYLPAREVG